MEKTEFTAQELRTSIFNRFTLSRDAKINMVGVILFYVIVFVAVNVFSGPY